MHVYPNSQGKGSKTLTASGAMVRSKYRSQQTIMLYLRLKAQEYFNINKVLNLVVDAIDRKKDLFYQVRIFSSYPFETGRCNGKYKTKLTLPFSGIGGGVPSSPLFYKNPQWLVMID